MSGAIVGAAFLPHPPLLVPSIAGSAAAEVADLLAACDSAIADVLDGAGAVVILGSGTATRELPPGSRGSLRGFGAPDDRVDAGEPLPLTIGGWLLDRHRGARAVRMLSVADGGDLDVADLGGSFPVDTALLVMGDGSARRGVKAPGYLDERAAPFDDLVRTALTAADPGGLAGFDLGLGADLLAAGVPAWRAAGRLLAGGRWEARSYYDGDPFGVKYLVATWLPA